MINVLDYGLIANPSFDCTPAWNALLANTVALAQSLRIYFPVGTYYFNSKPNIITTPLYIFGDGINGTALVRNYSAVDYNEGLLHSVSTLNVRDLSIHAGAGTAHGCAIMLDGLHCSSSMLDNLYITTLGGTWDIAVYLTSNDPLGIRGCYLNNLQLFASTIRGVWAVNVRGLTLRVNVFEAGGGISQILLQGSGTGGFCQNVQIETYYLTDLWLYNTQNVNIKAVGNTNLHQDPFCSGVKVY